MTAYKQQQRPAERALVLRPILKSDVMRGDAAILLEEAVGLARALDLDIIEAHTVTVARPAPSTLLGKGQVENFGERIAAEDIKLAIIDHTLSPVQQRTLEKRWNCKVIDRTSLILEIFGKRARTHEGQLQVELASLDYQKSRLVRSWTHLERQRGGFGFLGGPGESQLEIDRRLIGKRIIKIKSELKEVRQRRGLQREQRHRSGQPTIALIGYTNAGKSTLFNRLTGADVLAKDMLFATLDPTMRRIKLPGGREAILSDTVGFISQLPTHLIEAFRATLEEVQEADIILHIRDASHPDTAAQRQAVMDVLADLGIDQEDERLVEVLNKIDCLPEHERQQLKDYAKRTTWEAHQVGHLEGLRAEAKGGMTGVSALTGEGLEQLLELIQARLATQTEIYDIEIDRADGAALSWLYEHGHILKKKDTKTKSNLKIELDAADYGRFLNKFDRESQAKGKARKNSNS